MADNAPGADGDGEINKAVWRTIAALYARIPCLPPEHHDCAQPPKCRIWNVSQLYSKTEIPEMGLLKYVYMCQKQAVHICGDNCGRRQHSRSGIDKCPITGQEFQTLIPDKTCQYGIDRGKSMPLSSEQQKMHDKRRARSFTTRDISCYAEYNLWTRDLHATVSLAKAAAEEERAARRTAAIPTTAAWTASGAAYPRVRRTPLPGPAFDEIAILNVFLGVTPLCVSKGAGAIPVYLMSPRLSHYAARCVTPHQLALLSGRVRLCTGLRASGQCTEIANIVEGVEYVMERMLPGPQRWRFSKSEVIAVQTKCYESTEKYIRMCLRNGEAVNESKYPEHLHFDRMWQREESDPRELADWPTVRQWIGYVRICMRIWLLCRYCGANDGRWPGIEPCKFAMGVFALLEKGHSVANVTIGGETTYIVVVPRCGYLSRSGILVEDNKISTFGLQRKWHTDGLQQVLGYMTKCCALLPPAQVAAYIYQDAY